MAEALSIHQKRTLRDLADGRTSLWYVSPATRRALERKGLTKQIEGGEYWDFEITDLGRQALATGVVPSPSPSLEGGTRDGLQ